MKPVRRTSAPKEQGRPPKLRQRIQTRVAASYTATEAKNEFGRLLEQAIHGEPVIITRHDAPKAVLMSYDQFRAVQQAPEMKIDALSREFDLLFERMQTTSSRAATNRLFRMSSQQLGKAAIHGARKRG